MTVRVGVIAAAAAIVLAAASAAVAGESCTPRQGAHTKVGVSFAPPEGGMVAGLTMIIDYPERKVSLPGTGTAVAKSAIGGTPTGAVVGGNDTEIEVKIVLAAPGEISPGKVVEIAFEACEGADAAAASDFSCRVLEAADPMANLVRDVTCRVTLP